MSLTISSALIASSSIERGFRVSVTRVVVTRTGPP
jgi:hypothetical protein